MDRFQGLSNGELLRAVEVAGYDVLLTADKGIPYQQSVSDRQVAVVVLRPGTNRLADLVALVPAVLETLESVSAGEIVFVPARLL